MICDLRYSLSCHFYNYILRARAQRPSRVQQYIYIVSLQVHYLQWLINVQQHVSVAFLWQLDALPQARYCPALTSHSATVRIAR